MFNWAAERATYGFDTSPFTGIRSQRVLGDKPTRDRILDEAEIFAFARNVGRLGYPYGSVYRLLLLNPAIIWSEIGECLRDKQPLPEWVCSYLIACSDRMFSAETRAKKDTRAALQWIFGFDFTGKGEASPFESDPDAADRALFCMRFAVAIEDGFSPNAAIDQASTVLAAKRADVVKVRTLKKWLTSEFRGSEKAPFFRSRAKWSEVCRHWFATNLSAIEQLDRDFGA